MFFFFFQAEDGIRDYKVTGVQTCALPIYLDGTDVTAGAAQARGVGELGRPPQPEQLWGQHRADGAWIDRPVRVAADLPVYRAGVEARAAADARERLPGHRGRQQARAAVVEQHDVQLRRPLILRAPLRAREQRLIRR